MELVLRSENLKKRHGMSSFLKEVSL